MKNLFNMNKNVYNHDYFERGAEAGVSLYSNYRWIPELTLPLCHHLVKELNIKNEKILDFGCAKGYVVKGLRMLGYKSYGVDLSTYAISKASNDTKKFLKLIKPYQKLKNKFDIILAKDVLEHIPYNKINTQLKIFRNATKKIFILVPLGNGKKYYIKSMEMDKTHIIREDLRWWKNALINSGFKIEKCTYNLGPFKKNWQFHKRGNGLIIAT